MGNMGAVAQQLGTIMNSDLSAAITNAALKASGFYGATNALTAALQKYGAGSPQAEAAANNVTQAWNKAQAMAAKVASEANTAQAAIDRMHGKTIDIGVVTQYSQTGGASAPAGVGLGHLQAGAKGIPSARPGMSLVGEEGPELVMMRGGEQVLTASHTKAMLSLAAAARKIPGYATGTSGSDGLMKQIERELSVLVLRVTSASSASGVRYYIDNLLASIKEAGQDKDISAGQESDLTKFLGRDNKKLQSLVSERAKIAATLRSAEQYASQVTTTAEGTASLSSILGVIGSGPVTSATIEANLKIDLAAIQRFNADIKTLKKMGLDKNLLGQIIQMGPVQGDQVAQALIHGPMSEIQQLNTTEAAVVKASKAEGQWAVNAMYGTGKDAGKGFIEGLKAEEKAIDKEMKKIAEAIVKALKRDLKAHSPSGATRPIGWSVIDGIILGARDRLPSLDSALKTAAGHIPSALGSAAGRGGAGGGDMNLHLTLQLPSPRENYRAVQTQTLRVNRRNSDNRLALRVR
jgi:hypothetical protein